MFNLNEAAYGVLVCPEPEYLRHVNDDVAAHWDESETLAPNAWRTFAARVKTYFTES